LTGADPVSIQSAFRCAKPGGRLPLFLVKCSQQEQISTKLIQPHACGCTIHQFIIRFITQRMQPDTTYTMH